ncbi:hypothetical protein SB659_18580 [Arthrobacter sp. SIMBA_036]|uniref:hypothetical protein n=1 Tax=Arthrobacter sp. SIMBA_036 TaxID=3085778 RepID=UPI0039788037
MAVRAVRETAQALWRWDVPTKLMTPASVSRASAPYMDFSATPAVWASNTGRSSSQGMMFSSADTFRGFAISTHCAGRASKADTDSRAAFEAWRAE